MNGRIRLIVFGIGAAGVLALLVAAFPGLPPFGTSGHPYRDRAVAAAVAHGTANVVGAVNFDQRGLDTLGEEVILLGSVLATAVLLRPADDERQRPPPAEPVLPATELLGYLILPVTLLVGLSVVTHGAVTPGGGFQGGVVAATGLHLLYIAGSYRVLQRLRPTVWSPSVEAAGAGAFVALALAGIGESGVFLANLFPPGTLGDLSSAGSVEPANVAVGVAVFGAVVTLLAQFLRQEETLEGRRR